MALERAFAERSASVTERGRRRVNQDAALAVTLADGAELLAVADGMGGHAAGEVASRSALEALLSALERGAGLRQAVESANRAVLAEAAARPEYQGMGTTLVALLRRGDEYSIANVGDSRAYLLDEHGIRQLTRDHSFVEDAVRSGQLTAEEAGASPWRNALTRAIGLGPELEVDVYGPYPVDEPHLVILCTDGLYRAVLPAEIEKVAVQTTEPAALAMALAAAAYEGGSDDNITLALGRFGPDPVWAVPATASEPRPAAGAAAQPPVPGASPREPRPEPAPLGREPVPAHEPGPRPAAHAPQSGEARAAAGAAPAGKAPTAREPRRQLHASEQQMGHAGGRRTRRRRRHGATGRWAFLEVAAIMLGVLAVILYVFFLSKML